MGSSDIERAAGVTPLMEMGQRKARAKQFFVREAIGEFFGTLVLCFMCIGASSQFMMKGGNESQIVPVFGIVFGILIATVTTGGVSGAHINPSVSIGLCVAGEMSWLSLPGYLIGQLLGAIVGSLIAWSLVEPMIRHRFIPEGENLQEYDQDNDLGIAGVFSPLRAGFTVGNGVATEFVLTCLLLMCVCAAIDKRSAFKPPKFLLSIIFPLVIAGFAFCHDLPSGTLLNPARDLGPRLAAVILGWNTKYVFKSLDWEGNEQHWWIVGIFGPISGAILGAIIYSFVIGPQVNTGHLDEEKDDEHDVPKSMSSPYTIRGNERPAEPVMMPAKSPETGTADWRSNTRFVPKPYAPPPVPQTGGYNNSYQQPNNPNGYANQAFKGY